MRSDPRSIQERTKLSNVLIGVAISSLFFISAFNPEIFKTNVWFVSQLILSVPILLSAALFSSKIITAKNPFGVKIYSSLLFSVGYAFIMNAVGIIVSMLAGANIAPIFFGINILNALIYSGVMIVSEKQKFSHRLYKDAMFIITLIVGGVLQVI